MQRTLLVTNDFPPRIGGIQSYIHEIASRLDPERLVVLTSRYPGDKAFDAEQPFPVVRHPTRMLLPTRSVQRAASELIREHGLTAVWFGAAAPLALLTGSLRRAGIRTAVASTHGHEVGWSMFPGTRQMLRAIGRGTDVITYVSRYARGRIAAALGPTAALEALSPGVDSETFFPNAESRRAIRARHGLGDDPVVVCVSRLVPRKGQDWLIEVWPQVRAAHPRARLLIVGDGPYAATLHTMAEASPARNSITFTGSVPHHELPECYRAGDIFAMPCRTRGRGLDVEGLGIVFLEASACGLPVIAGNSGGAPETVRAEETGMVVADKEELTAGLVRLLGDAALRERWGAAGRQWARAEWTWQATADRLATILGP